MRPNSCTLPTGEKIPALGLGTWHMGEDPSEAGAEANALRAGLDLGLTLIDTAEMYGEGGAEEVVGQAIAGRRDEVFLVSKVYPWNASLNGVPAACERSLRRMAIETIDLYLLHWPGSHPLEDTLRAFEDLKAAGKIRHWGVSNFGDSEMAKLGFLPDGKACTTNQVLYHPGERGIEWDLLPRHRQLGMPIMAYSPLGQGEVLNDPSLLAVADKHGVGAAAISLAWVMREDGVIAIPKTSSLGHLRENAAALEVTLDEEDLTAIDAAFPPPQRARPLSML